MVRLAVLAFALVLLGASGMSARAQETGLRGPDVTLIESEERAVYEYRQNGQLRLVKIVPRIGKPYYLVPRDPTEGYGDLEQAEMLLPRWTIVEF